MFLICLQRAIEQSCKYPHELLAVVEIIFMRFICTVFASRGLYKTRSDCALFYMALFLLSVCVYAWFLVCACVFLCVIFLWRTHNVLVLPTLIFLTEWDSREEGKEVKVFRETGKRGPLPQFSVWGNLLPRRDPYDPSAFQDGFRWLTVRKALLWGDNERAGGHRTWLKKKNTIMLPDFP